MDTSVYRRIFEISMMGEIAPETAHLSAVSVEHYGKLTVSVFELPTTDRVLYDFTDHLGGAALSKNVQKTPSIVIDHWFTPRRAASMRLQSKASLAFKDVPLNGILRGYGFISYFEARFNDGDPAVLSIFVNNKKIGEEVIGNFDPLRPFHYPLNESGTGTVRFEVTAPNNGKRQFGLQADVRLPGGDR